MTPDFDESDVLSVLTARRGVKKTMAKIITQLNPKDIARDPADPREVARFCFAIAKLLEREKVMEEWLETNGRRERVYFVPKPLTEED